MTAVLGLRERKRAQTRRRLEEAAIDLALRDGLDQVTIEAITERADVSRRTFFNYFDSKDDAILGLRPPDVAPRPWRLIWPATPARTSWNPSSV